ncbi:MAG: hypothetical protein J6R88_02650 [Clostridia bacterium]|nr:hypothetical protein [Clostridia bacterium]
MFGYLKPDKPYLYMKDDVLYQALYCGVCKSIGKNAGQIARFTLTYDVAFMSAICHNILGVDVKINKEHCITHVIRKTPVAEPDEISLMLADVNVILAYYKLLDDTVDEKKGALKSKIFLNAYKKAKKRMPEFDNIVKTQTANLLALERANSDSIDMVADSTANILVNASRQVLKDKSTEYTDGLFYSIGKWIYLIDALDDYDQDVKKVNFNVFFNAYKETSFENLIKNKGEEISFVFNGIF